LHVLVSDKINADTRCLYVHVSNITFC